VVFVGNNFRLIFIIGGLGLLVLGILVLFLFGFQLSMQDNQTEPEEEDNSVLNPSTATFYDFWSIDIHLDRTNYSLGDNVTLSMNLTCLIDHNVTDYRLGTSWRATRLLNITGDIVWVPDYFPPEIIYGIYEFKEDHNICYDKVLYLGTTLEKPSSIDGAFWIPPISSGHYTLKIVPPSAYCTTFSGINIQLSFEVT
jgi:hypothetical protein